MFDKEKNQGRFRMWKSGKQWLYSGLIIIVLIGVGVVGGSGLIHNTEAEVAEKSRVTYLDGRRENDLPGAEGERSDSNESLVESGFELSSGGEVEVGYELKNGGTVVVGFEPV
ncbi:KxYKxGKxW signal peptide domain-containing protein [Streptococcus suis]|uniref:KxYKxGKxW signal peptide domain-containing protein n=1 Tax=Streptococcus suis TaxID=1307 RepID=UPI001EE863C7|nr:KxYKxGKxW signal peptide domain-containing protein [Streptococcus suis]